MAKIAEISKDERPRERLLKLGAKALSTPELIAILIRTGTKGKSALEIANEMISKAGSIRTLFNSSFVELSKIKGLNKAKITTLLASIELARRYSSETGEKRTVIKGPEDVYHLYKSKVLGLQQEVFIVLYLNSKNEIVSEEQLGSSTANSCLCHPQEFIRGLLNRGASRMILIHNHPSGDKKASQKDIDFTKELSSHLKYFGFELLDHLIIADNGYTSLKDEGVVR
ncbi:MAG: DNA repair protein RadC [bacterium]